MDTHSAERWVLAFDASRGRCRGSRCVTHTDVVRWREQTPGGDAPWAPTLLRVAGDGVGGSTVRAE
jgi:hypothetical protein